MSRKFAPRIAGRRLKALAAALRVPVAGPQLADFLLETGGMARLRHTPPEDPRLPAIPFRAGPRPPRS